MRKIHRKWRRHERLLRLNLPGPRHDILAHARRLQAPRMGNLGFSNLWPFAGFLVRILGLRERRSRRFAQGKSALLRVFQGSLMYCPLARTSAVR